MLGLVAHLDPSAQRAPKAAPGIITGVVVNEQHETVAVSASGRPAAGMPVRLFHRFGGEGSESSDDKIPWALAQIGDKRAVAQVSVADAARAAIAKLR